MLISKSIGRGLGLGLGRTAIRSAGLKVRAFSTTNPRISQAAAAKSCPEPPEPRMHFSESSRSSGRDEFWRRVPIFKDVSFKEFTSYSWTMKNVVQHNTRSKDENLREILTAVLPNFVPCDQSPTGMQSREELIEDIFQGIRVATMSLRIMPHVLSRINWQDPRNCPVFRQFIPLKSILLPDHPKLTLDSLHEKADEVVEDTLIHRYPDKALFLTIGVCPTYCSYCTRAHTVGADTDAVEKQKIKPILGRWEEAFQYIASHPELVDIVVSGGDTFYLSPDQVAYIGRRLIDIPNVRKFRFASKGLAVCPTRYLDDEDKWIEALIYVHREAVKAGKRMALHTHFNHPNEISWLTQLASRKLVEAGVTVRNQTVLLRGINDDVQTMSTLIRELAETLGITPYYVYQCDMVKNTEHFRTPLQTLLDLESQIRGSIAGFDMPQFIVDLPRGGGKRLACSFLEYNRDTGVSKFVAPAVKGHGSRDKRNMVYEYYDPVKV